MDNEMNDAPVTVEQDPYLATIEEFEHEDQRELCRLYNHRPDDSLQFSRGNMREAIRHGRRLAALASAPAGVNITVRQKTPVVADYGDNFLVAQVSADGKTVGIDHPCDAVWSDVDRAQTALRDYINERIAGQDKCPFKPRDTVSAPDEDGEMGQL